MGRTRHHNQPVEKEGFFMWQYRQSNGDSSRDGHSIGAGYSGRGAGKFNPAMEGERNVGPIPRGMYRIGGQFDHPTKGSVTMGLTPVGHAALGRTEFLIHGDSREHPGEASEGCIVLGRVLRQVVADSGDIELEVVR
jgi:Protein of unknown function (DUF2778)